MKTKKILSILLSVCVILAFMPQMAFADTVASITYLDASGAQKTCDNATPVTEDDTTWGTDGQTTWYVAQGYVTIESRVTVSGTVNLILKDGCTLNASKGIEVKSENDLTIYAQSAPKFNEDGTLARDNTAGMLNATGAGSQNVGIGSNSVGGRITINGGCINATGCYDDNISLWGIGAASNCDITINGGYVVATGGKGIEGSNITINNGVVTATGNGFTGIEGNTTISGGTVRATGNYGGAGIGGPVTISGGTVEAIANGSGAGIGGDNGKLSGPIVISGGAVNATSKNGAGIGGGHDADFGDITISDGVVTATSTDGAGIGGGYRYHQTNGNIHSITISGGVVEANSTNGSGIGVGYGFQGNPFNHNIMISGGTVKASSDNGAGIGFEGQTNSTFSTTDNGNAVVFAKSIIDQTGKNNWRGVFFEGTDDGAVYGTSVTPTDDFTIPAGTILTIDSGKSLNIHNSVTLTNNGKIYVDGTFTGTADNLYYPLTLVNATASGDTSEHNSKNYGKAGSTISLSAESQVGKIISWDSSPKVEINDNSFTMPAAALTVTAQWIKCKHEGKTEIRNAKEATCTEEGYSGDEYCKSCGEIISTGLPINKLNHDLVNIPAKDATAAETGNDEYWQCNDCKKYFSDADGTNEITDLDSWKAGEGKIDKLTVPTKTDSLTTDKDGGVTVTLDRSVTTSDSKTTATVTDTVVNQILAKLASSDSKSVVINAATGSNATSAEPGISTLVTISESSVKSLAEIDGIELTLVTDNGRVVLDSKAIATVSASAGNDGQVTLSIETVEKSNNLLKVDISISTSCG
ncbi:MAG: hypothetical protein ACI4KE_02330, partial [Anaerovoracaceae bacterium]